MQTIRIDKMFRKKLPVTRHFGSGSIGLEPSFRERTKNSRKEEYSSRGNAASSISEIKLGFSFFSTQSQFCPFKENSSL